VPPKKVSQATANLRAVSDTVVLYMATECKFEEGAKISCTVFREMLEKWCEEEGYRQQISKKKLFRDLRDMGVIDGGKSGIDRYWSGIRLKNEQERIVAEQILQGQNTLSGL
jgi:phage/plasmid-associated DNA primase